MTPTITTADGTETTFLPGDLHKLANVLAAVPRRDRLAVARDLVSQMTAFSHESTIGGLFGRPGRPVRYGKGVLTVCHGLPQVIADITTSDGIDAWEIAVVVMGELVRAVEDARVAA